MPLQVLQTVKLNQPLGVKALYRSIVKKLGLNQYPQAPAQDVIDRIIQDVKEFEKIYSERIEPGIDEDEGEQDYETFRPPTSGKAGILIDLTHDQGKWAYEYDSSSIFEIAGERGKDIRPIALADHEDLLEVRQVSEDDHIPLREVNLDEWKGMVLGIPHEKHISKTTRNKITRWVHRGGRLLLLGFELGDRHHRSNLNSVAEEFGIRFNSDIVAPKGWKPPNEKAYDKAVKFPIVDPGAHSILEGVQSLYLENVCTLTLEPGSKQILQVGDNGLSRIMDDKAAYTNGRLSSGIQDFRPVESPSSMAVIAEAPKGLTKLGRVIAIGTWDLLGRKHEFMSGSYGNTQFLQNLFRWLGRAEK